jgi:hypothetical protein
MARGPLRIATGVVLRPPAPHPRVGTVDFALQAYLLFLQAANDAYVPTSGQVFPTASVYLLKK